MGVEPAFAGSVALSPLAGFGAAPAEPDDPRLAIPYGSLRIGLRDRQHSFVIANSNAELTAVAGEPLAVKQPAGRAQRRKWLLAITASCIIHASAAIFFLHSGEEQALIAGGEQAEVALLGSAAEDQSSAGEAEPITNVSLITMLDAKPVETIEATPVVESSVTETVEAAAVETPVSETIEPVEERPEQPDKPADTAKAAVPERIEPEASNVVPTVSETVPEILASDRVEPLQDDNIVQKPAEIAAVPPVEPVETIAPEPERAKPAEVKKPKKQAVEKKKPARKAPPKKKSSKAGSAGKNEADSRKGEADGDRQGKTASNSGSRKQSAAGNAAVSNYPGKVVSKLRRALRYPSEAKRKKLRGEVRVSFTVSAGGGVGGIRVVRSSGSPVLDQAAIETVRRAAPFPAIPANAGRSNWPFTVPLAFTR